MKEILSRASARPQRSVQSNLHIRSAEYITVVCCDVREFGAPSFYLMMDVARALHAAVQQQDVTRVWLLLPCLQAQLQHQPPSPQDVDGLMQLVISSSSCAKGNAQVRT